MIYVLLFIILVVLIISIIFDKDIFSPAAIMCESYLLATICAILNIAKWGINLSPVTLAMISLGVLSFVIPSLIISKTYKPKEGVKEKKKQGYELNRQVHLILIIIQLVTLVVNFYYIRKTIGFGSIISFSDTIGEFRENTAYGDMESLVPSYVNQLVKISQITAYASLYDLINLIISKRKSRKKISIIFDTASIIVYIMQSFLSGGRYKLICFILGGLIMAMVMMWRKTHRVVNVKQISKIIIAIIGVLVLFSSTRTVVGRTNTDGVVDYISAYFGGSIQLLDLYNKHPLKKSEILGQETFYGINRTLSKIGIVPAYRNHLEFRTSNGIIIGNVYTAFRCFYRDFGYIGIILLQVFLAIFWTIWYKRIKVKKINSSFDSSLLFYSMYINCLFLSSFRDNFYYSAVSISTITIILYYFVIHSLLIKKV